MKYFPIKQMLVTVYNKVIYDERNERSRTVDLFCVERRSTNQTSCITSRDRPLDEKAETTTLTNLR